MVQAMPASASNFLEHLLTRHDPVAQAWLQNGCKWQICWPLLIILSHPRIAAVCADSKLKSH